MKCMFRLILIGSLISADIFPVFPMRRIQYFMVSRGVRTCANQTPKPPVKSVHERIANIDEQLAELVKNSKNMQKN